MKAFLRRPLGSALLLLAFSIFLTGCATARDSDNESARPWNAPRNWENGFPTGLDQQRR
jgi:hypothetical protein